MINSFLQIEIAYSMLGESNNTIEEAKHPIDTHYKKSKCDLEPIDPNSREFHLIEQYMAKTHDQYTLKLRHRFKTTRDGELDRFKKFASIS